MKSKLFTPSPAKPAKLEPLKFKPLDGWTFRDTGIGTGRPDADAIQKLREYWERHPPRKGRKGEKDAVQLLKEARESLDRR